MRRIKNTAFGKAVRLIGKRDRRKLTALAVFQVALSGLDLIGIALIGFLGVLAVSGIQSQGSNGKVNVILNLLGLHNQSIQIQNHPNHVRPISIFQS